MRPGITSLDPHALLVLLVNLKTELVTHSPAAAALLAPLHKTQAQHQVLIVVSYSNLVSLYVNELFIYLSKDYFGTRLIILDNNMNTIGNHFLYQVRGQTSPTPTPSKNYMAIMVGRFIM